MNGSPEDGSGYPAPRPGRTSEEDVDRLAELMGGMDRFERAVRLGRRMRWLLPTFSVFALGIATSFEPGLASVLRGVVMLGVALGYVELVTWRYSKRIEAMQLEAAKVLRSNS